MRYWQTWAGEHISQLSALTDNRNGIIRAFSFAMQIDSAWELDYQLITRFSLPMEQTGHWQAWEDLLRQAVQNAHRLGDGENEANLSALLGLLLQRQQKYLTAIKQHQYTLHIVRQWARSLTNLGYLQLLSEDMLQIDHCEDDIVSRQEINILLLKTD